MYSAIVWDKTFVLFNRYNESLTMNSEHLRHQKEMIIWGLILARGCNKSIPNKNIRVLNDKPLICWVLEPMIESGIFDKIWVSTDDEKIANIVRKYKVNIHWRSKESADDFASSAFAVKEFLNINNDVDIICLVQCTSPCLHPCYLLDAYKLMTENLYDSIFSVTRSHKFRWSEDLKPLNLDPTQRLRRQDWNGEYLESGHFYWFTKKLLEDEGLIQGGKCGVIEMPNHMCVEIDNEFDWIFAETVVKNFGYKSQLFSVQNVCEHFSL